MAARVRAGARLHFGFLNLALAHERLYGSVGAAIDEPTVTVTARRAERVDADPAVASYAKRAVAHLGVPGARVRSSAGIPRHIGLGSGTQHALATYRAIAEAWGRDPDVRDAAPALDRGGRSGIGVAAFEDGGFVIDAGHPTERFTLDRPERGRWRVPPVMVRHDLPGSWRFVLVRPDVRSGLSGTDEDRSFRSVVEVANPGIADEISAITTRRLLPAVASRDRRGVGGALTEIGRLNGVWYADEQGGVYRPPIGGVIDELAAVTAVDGVGQSSWGPTVYALCSAEAAEGVRRAAEAILDTVRVEGSVTVARPRNSGASVSSITESEARNT